MNVYTAINTMLGKTTTATTNEPEAKKTITAAATTTQAETPLAVRRIAAVLYSSGCGPFDLPGIRWALSRLGEVAAREPVQIASLLIDEMLRVYDDNFVRTMGHRQVIPECYDACRRPDGPLCEGIVDGVVIKHTPHGKWIVEGAEFPSDRVAAERHARKVGTLRRLVAELGIDGGSASS